MAFNQTGQLKAYDDCGYDGLYLTPQSVDHTIIEYSINESSDQALGSDLNSFGGIDLGLFDDNKQQEDEFEKANITQAQIDCLIDIREVEKSMEYKDCGYVGSDTSQAVDQRLSDLSMKLIPTTENKTQKDALQQEAVCLVDIRSMEKQTSKQNQLGTEYNQLGGILQDKSQDYEIIDGKVVKKSPTTSSPQGGIDAMITDLKNDGDALKAEIASTSLFNTGLVEFDKQGILL